MIVGTLKVELHILGESSLKGKRMILKSLKDRTRNRFNVSVAEIDDMDKWQKATLGISCVGRDKRYINGVLSKVMDLINQSNSVELIDCEMEIL